MRTRSDYRQWTTTVGGILEHAGIEGFLGNTDEVRERLDLEAAEWVPFLAEWRDWQESEDGPGKQGATTADAVGYFFFGGRPGFPADPGETVPQELAEAYEGGKSLRSSNIRVGRALEAREGTRFGRENLRLERAGKDSRSGSSFWRVEAG